MRTIFVRRWRCVIAAVLALTATTAQASEALLPIDAARAEALCPPPGGAPPLIITVREPLRSGGDGDRDRIARASFEPLANRALTPFESVDLELTSWSEQFSALVYRASLAEGVDPTGWRTQMEDSLRAAGWMELIERRLAGSESFGSALGSSLFVKSLATGAAQREMLIEVDTPGALYLRCGDLALLRLNAAEREGDLAPGSLRPVSVPPTPVEMPNPEDCDKPEWRAAFADVSEPKRIGAALEQVLPDPDVFDGGSRQAERLQRWLRWKLLSGGSLSEDALAEIEAGAGHLSPAAITEMEQSLEAMIAVSEAQAKGDGPGSCRALINFMLREHGRDLQEAERLGRINAALEAEGLRLGIALN